MKNLTDVMQSERSVRTLSETGRIIDPLYGDTAEKEISLLDLLIVIARHWRALLWTTLAAAVAGLLLAFLLPVRYTASTSILPPQQQGNSTGSSLMAQLGSLGSAASLAGGSLGLKNPNDLQVALLRSQTVEDAMIDRFHLMDLYGKKRKSDARKKFEKVVDIDSGSKDGLIRVSVTDRDAARAADMANAYIQEYRRLSASLAVTEASQRRAFFEQQLTQSKDNLANAEEELRKTEQRTGLIELDSQARAVIESVAQLNAQIAAKQVQIRAMRSFATGENPDLAMAEQELAGLRAEQQKLGASDQSTNALLVPKGDLQKSSLEYVRKLRDVKYYETIFNLIARQFEAAKVDEAKQGAVPQVVDRAILPDKRSSPQRLLIIASGIILGLLAGSAWIFSIEAYKRLSNNPAERSRLEELNRLLAPGKNPEVRL